MKTFLKLASLIITVFLCTMTLANHPHFSKVIFFGDSLSDMGNNLSGLDDQAPVTNKLPNDHNGFRKGETWTVPFLKMLQKDGYLSEDATIDVISSINFDKSIQIDPNASLDYAYSGDESGGYTNISGKPSLPQYHIANPDTGNMDCSDTLSPIPSDENSLCGVLQRATNFLKKTSYLCRSKRIVRYLDRP